MPWAELETIYMIDGKIGRLCTRKYRGHQKGCPNYNHKKGCPPRLPKLNSVIRSSGPIYIIWNVFLFREHVRRMESLHPEWSEYQLRCCLYWQGKARKELRVEVERFVMELHPARHYIIWCPEAYGVNVTDTMVEIGYYLEWPPENIAYQVVLAGVKESG